jgi:hypothetical protein
MDVDDDGFLDRRVNFDAEYLLCFDYTYEINSVNILTRLKDIWFYLTGFASLR